MAKTKTTEDTSDLGLGELLLKEFGKNDATADDAGFISTGYLPLNFALSNRYYDGGIPRARITEIAGPPSAGKTSLFTDIAVNVQQQGGFVGFEDYERSFDLRLATQRGLDSTQSKWFYRKPKTFEEGIGLFTQVAVAVRKSKKLGKAPILWGFDSLASMTPAVIYDKMINGGELNMKDKLELSICTSNYFKGIATICEDLDITAVFLNQLRQKPGVIYGIKTDTSGGDAPKYYATARIQLTASRLLREIKIDNETERQQIGSEVKACVVKNKASRPYQTAKWIFTFREDGTGYFDAIGSLTDLLINKGLIEAGARRSWYMWEGKERSRDQIVDILTKDTTGKKQLEDLLIKSNIVPDNLSKEEIEAIEVTANNEEVVE